SHLNFSPLGPILRILRRQARYVVVTYGVDAWKRPSGPVLWSLRRAAQVWTISNFTQQQLLSATGLSPNRVFVVPLALTPSQLQRLEAGRSQGETVAISHRRILCVSRLSRGEQKGIDYLLEAFAKV